MPRYPTGQVDKFNGNNGFCRSEPPATRVLKVRRSAVLCMAVFGFAPGWIGVAEAMAVRPVADPLRTSIVGNEDRLVILPSIEASYDTSTLPDYFKIDGRDRSNGRISPGLDVILNRSFARTSIKLDGSFGYDFNTRYKFLNQPRINIAGDLEFPTGNVCTVRGHGDYRQFRLNQSDLTQIGFARLRSQDYSVDASCNRQVGLSPLAGVEYTQQSTNDVAFYNSNTLTYRGGAAYTVPSLGTFTLRLSRDMIRRPKIKELTGINDGTDVTDVQLSLARSIAPRLSFRLGGGYFKAVPKIASVGSNSGASYDALITWLPRPALSASVSATRQITNEFGVSATYATVERYSSQLSWQISRPSSLQLTAERSYRNFTGESITPITIPINKDKATQLIARYSLNTLRRYRVSLVASHLWRDAANAVYNYQSTTLTVSLGARF